MKLLFTSRAEQDLAAIAEYIAAESGDVATAFSFIDRLIAKCEELAGHPFRMGTPRENLGSDIRSYAFGNYLILFRYQQEVMEVAMIIEGHRDLEALL